VPQPTQEPSLKDQDKIHILESAIVTWTKQIKNVLKADPDAPLKARQTEGERKGPAGWDQHHKGLERVRCTATGAVMFKGEHVDEHIGR
jgi:dynein heavy chain